MSDFSAILVPLSAALGLSLIVERTLELVQNLLERFLGKPRRPPGAQGTDRQGSGRSGESS